MNNQDQIDYWNGPSGQRWAQMQDYTDQILGRITQSFIPFAGARQGDNLLDIGCGCGTTTFTFAECVGRDGSAAGIDISAPMLGVARARAAASNADIPFIEADASSYDFQPVFDLVVSRFGVMFFADPATAFANIRKAFAPRGRLAFVCWRALAENGWAATPMAAAKAFLPPQDPPDPFAPGPFAFADGERLQSILAGAGFKDIRIEKFDGLMDLAKSADEAGEHMLRVGPLSRAAADLDETARAKLQDVAAQALKRYQTAEGVLAPAACWFVAAKV
jgi:SAM-dependent methyltransferase